MIDSLQQQGTTKERITNRDMVEGLRRALEKNHARVLQAAGGAWESRFAGKDPSDTCVSIRVSGWHQPALRPSERHAALPSFASQAA